MCALPLDPFIQLASAKGLLCVRQSVGAQGEHHQPGGEREGRLGGGSLEGVTPMLIQKHQIRTRQAKKGDEHQGPVVRPLRTWTSFSLASIH